MSGFLGIDIKTLDDGGFQFCQTRLIHKVMDSTVMDYCDELPTSTKVESVLGIDKNCSDSKRYWTNSYGYV